MKSSEKHWEVEIGHTPSRSNVLYDGKVLADIQAVQINVDASKSFTEITFRLVNPKIRIKPKDGLVACPKCEEEERIENKDW